MSKFGTFELCVGQGKVELNRDLIEYVRYGENRNSISVTLASGETHSLECSHSKMRKWLHDKD